MRSQRQFQVVPAGESERLTLWHPTLKQAALGFVVAVLTAGTGLIGSQFSLVTKADHKAAMTKLAEDDLGRYVDLKSDLKSILARQDSQQIQLNAVTAAQETESLKHRKEHRGHNQ